MRLSLNDIAKAIEDGTRTDSTGRNPIIDPHIAALHVHALLVERGLIVSDSQATPHRAA